MRIKKNVFLFVFILGFATSSVADEFHHHNRGTMPQAHANNTPLTEPGNGAFAAIQEAVGQLMANPNTDWRRVNLEALRQHLVDMDNFTLHVKVVSQKPVRGGVAFIVKPTTADAAGSLDRLFAAHPEILKRESGWHMHAKKIKGGGYSARVTSRNPADVAKIRGLGYIGIVALGKHHQ
jgi:hypothetical protein